MGNKKSYFDLKSLLINPELLIDKAYVEGKWIDSKSFEKFSVFNPATGQEIVKLPNLGVYETKSAINKAYEVQKKWAAETAKHRSEILRNFYNLMLDNIDDLTQILTAEMGKPLAEARGEVLYGASFIEWFSEEAKRVYGDLIPGHQVDKRISVIKQPIGVVASITPWNFPNAMIARKIGPALAVGCSFVSKPADETPLSALAMAYLGEKAGIPPGLFSVITSNKASIIGKEMCSNDKVRKLTFTGSTEVGKILLEQGARNVQKMSMELGGNAPFIVFDDADIDAAVNGALISKYRNNGQTCVCANRIYVHDKIYDNFSNKLVDAVKKMNVGNGIDDNVNLGPLISKEAIIKVQKHVEDAVEKGAKIELGGKMHKLGGTFFEPTVLTNVKSNMLIQSEETFGPVAPLFKFKDDDEVISLANDTIFGLAAYFYSKDIKRITKVSEQLEFGIVGVNTGIISTEVAPFGGVKQSGVGREGSKYGIDDYLEMKYVCLSLDYKN